MQRSPIYQTGQKTIMSRQIQKNKTATSNYYYKNFLKKEFCNAVICVSSLSMIPINKPSLCASLFWKSALLWYQKEYWYLTNTTPRALTPPDRPFFCFLILPHCQLFILPFQTCGRYNKALVLAECQHQGILQETKYAAFQRSRDFGQLIVRVCSAVI